MSEEELEKVIREFVGKDPDGVFDLGHGLYLIKVGKYKLITGEGGLKDFDDAMKTEAKSHIVLTGDCPTCKNPHKMDHTIHKGYVPTNSKSRWCGKCEREFFIDAKGKEFLIV